MEVTEELYEYFTALSHVLFAHVIKRVNEGVPIAGRLSNFWERDTGFHADVDSNAPFDLEHALSTSDHPRPLAMVYALAITKPARVSFATYLNEAGTEQKYVNSLIQEGVGIAQLHDRLRGISEAQFRDRLYSGFFTGVVVATQLSLISNALPLTHTHRDALRLSKVHGDINFQQSMGGIGLPDGSYTLISPSIQSVDVHALPFLGYGQGVGCPAGNVLVEPFKSEIEQRFGPQPKNIIFPLTQLVAKEMPHLIQQYQILPARKKKKLSEPDRALLEGNARYITQQRSSS